METFRAQRIILTALGDSVLSDKVNTRNVRPRDQWLGGVHLHASAPFWRYNAERKQMEIAAT